MSKIVDNAVKEIGEKESPKNSNKTKYGKWFGLDGYPWCAMFVSYVYAMAGSPLPNIGFTKGFAGCQTAYSYFKKKKWFTNNPTAGDIVLFDWNGDGRYNHTGIFVKWIDANHFETIEGNTSYKNQSNGGEVMRRIRIKKNVLFAHPEIH